MPKTLENNGIDPAIAPIIEQLISQASNHEGTALRLRAAARQLEQLPNTPDAPTMNQTELSRVEQLVDFLRRADGPQPISAIMAALGVKAGNAGQIVRHAIAASKRPGADFSVRRFGKGVYGLK